MSAKSANQERARRMWVHWCKFTAKLGLHGTETKNHPGSGGVFVRRDCDCHRRRNLFVISQPAAGPVMATEQNRSNGVPRYWMACWRFYSGACCWNVCVLL